MPAPLGNIGLIAKIQKMTRTKTWVASGTDQIVDIPTDMDVVALGFDFRGVHTAPAAPAKVVDNPMAIVHDFTLNGDGNSIIDLNYYELRWFHHLFWGKVPITQETSIIAGAGKTFRSEFLIPLGHRLDLAPYKQLTIDLTWGALADLDGGAGFAITTAPVLKTAVYAGKSSRSFYTKRHVDGPLTGDGQKTVPKGQLLAIMINTASFTDTIDTLELVDNGLSVFKGDWEQAVSQMNQLWDIDVGYYGDVEAAAGVAADSFAGYRRPGMVLLDGSGVVSDGVNTVLKYHTTGADTLNILYIYEGQVS